MLQNCSRSLVKTFAVFIKSAFYSHFKIQYHFSLSFSFIISPFLIKLSHRISWSTLYLCPSTSALSLPCPGEFELCQSRLISLSFAYGHKQRGSHFVLSCWIDSRIITAFLPFCVQSIAYAVSVFFALNISMVMLEKGLWFREVEAKKLNNRLRQKILLEKNVSDRSDSRNIIHFCR